MSFQKLFQKNPKIKQIVVSREKVREIVPENGDMMCQVFPRNIGIRHATMDYILMTNIDIIVPPRQKILEFLENDDTMYVISRRDVNMSATCLLFNANNNIVYDILEWHTVERNLLADTDPEEFFKKDVLNQLSEHDELYTNYIKYARIYNCGDFQMASRKVWNKIKGFEENMILHWGIDTNVQTKVVKSGLNLKILKEPAVFHMHHGARSSHIRQELK